MPTNREAGAGRPPWVRREFPSLFSVEETARRVGSYTWIEMKMFEIMGGWVALAPELEIKLQLGNHCYHHAFHAELWHKRLPELRELDPARLTVAPNADFETFIEAVGQPIVGEPMNTESTIEKLTGMYRVLLPAMIGTYTYHLNNTSTITDGPSMRNLQLCLADDMQEWREGEMMLDSLLVDDASIDRATQHQAKLAKLLRGSGGVAGSGDGDLGGERIAEV